MAAKPAEGTATPLTRRSGTGLVSLGSRGRGHPLLSVVPREYVRFVPRISAFYGIVIAMYFDDHPPPHFHARYGEHQAQIVIATGDVLHGELPRRALKLVEEWAALHRDELLDDWERAQRDEPLVTIAPLP